MVYEKKVAPIGVGWIAAVWVASLAACVPDMDGKNKCNQDDDCLHKRRCHRGVCVESCDLITDCSLDEQCLDGMCVDKCVHATDCDPDEHCQEGACVETCNLHTDCPQDESCDMLFEHSTHACYHARTCAIKSNCAEPMQCVSGLCVDFIKTNCFDYEGCGYDDCGSDQLCMYTQGDIVPSCYRLPVCEEDGACPIGRKGSMCNLVDLAEKDRVCLPGRCKTDLHCPKDRSCVISTGKEIGFCELIDF